MQGLSAYSTYFAGLRVSLKLLQLLHELVHEIFSLDTVISGQTHSQLLL